MNNNEFERRKQNAVNQMREMNAKSTNPPPSNDIPLPKTKPETKNFGFELPFANLLKDKDTALILGLLLILYGEKADKMLLFALVYILM